MSKVLTREQILKISHKPLVIRSKVYGSLKLRGFLSLNDISDILKFVIKKLDDKEFTVAVLNAQIIVKDEAAINLESWDDKRLISVTRKLGEKVFANDLNGQKIKTYSDFKIVAEKHVEEFNKNTAKTMKGFYESINKTLKIQEQMANIVGAVTKNLVLDMQVVTSGITSMLANTIRTFDVARVVQATLIPSLPNLDVLFDFIEKSKRETDEILILLEESEYELAIDVLQDRYFRELLKIKISQRKAVVTKKLVQITASYEFNKDLEKLFEATCLGSRWHPLKQALLAHQSHQYYLSVPVFLAQAEGIFTDLLVLKKLAYKKEKMLYALANGFPKKNRSGKLLRLDTLGQKTTHAKGHFEEDKFIEITVDAIVGRFVKVRNGVFHGRINNYGTAANSTKALLLVFTLAGLFERDVNSSSDKSVVDEQ